MSCGVSRYLPNELQKVRPRQCPESLLGWIVPTLRATEDEVILVAGVDAALYLKLITFGEAFSCLLLAARNSCWHNQLKSVL